MFKGKMRASWSIIISICLAVTIAAGSSFGAVISEKSCAAIAAATPLGAVVSEKSSDSSTAAASSLGVVVSEMSSVKAHDLKLPDFFRLAVQYSLSVCEKMKCGHTTTRANLPTAFSIHGLWKGMNDRNKAAPVTSLDKFDVTKLAGIKGELDKYWFDALKFDKPAEYPIFWEREWEKYGRRSGYHLRDYFETTVKAAYGEFHRGFDDLVKRNNKYLPSREFKLNEFVNSFATTRLAAVSWARCHRHTNGTYLVMELLFRIDPVTGAFMSQTKDDDTDRSCSSEPEAVGLLPSTVPI